MAFQLMLAPMEKVTDAPFRTLCHRHGADLTFSEIARVANLARSKAGELEKIRIDDATPTQLQLAGAKTEESEKFLATFEPTARFMGFNLNLGCPSPAFLRQGIGAAMIKRVTRVNEIVGLVRTRGFECSVKLRLGLNQYEKERGAYLNLIEKVDASFFVVHARTAEQTESDPADFSIYDKCVKTGKKIVANGGIKTRGQCVELEGRGLMGAMIGSAAIGHPEIFEELKIS